MFRLRRGLSHPKLPRWKVAGRQSSSVSVLLPTVVSRCCYSPKRKRGGRLVAVKQESIPGRVLWPDAVLVIHNSKHLARPPWQGGWAVAIFIFLISTHSRSVPFFALNDWLCFAFRLSANVFEVVVKRKKANLPVFRDSSTLFYRRPI